jgi:hypothetical protein
MWTLIVLFQVCGPASCEDGMVRIPMFASKAACEQLGQEFMAKRNGLKDAAASCKLNVQTKNPMEKEIT